jgi:hypothetical protein
VVSITTAAVHVETGQGNPGSTQEVPGALGIPMLHLKISAGAAESINVQSIRVTTAGSGDDSTEIAVVRLIRDVDGDGAAGIGDVQAGLATFSVDDGNIDFDTSAQPTLAAGGTVHYLVECDFAGTAFTTSDFAFSVPVPVGVTCQSAVTLNGVTPTGSMVTGGVKTIATSGTGSLAVSLGGNSPAAGTVGSPSGNVPMLQVRLRASSMEAVNVSVVKFAASGTGDESVKVTAHLWRDNDGDGQVSGGDVDLGAGTITGDNGTVEFTGLSLQVPASNSVAFLVAYDFGAGAVLGTYGVSLEVGQDIDASGNSSSMGITATGAPVAGPLLTLVEGGVGSGSDAVYFMGGCGAPVHPSPTGWLDLMLMLISGIGIFVVRRGWAKVI